MHIHARNQRFVKKNQWTS